MWPYLVLFAELLIFFRQVLFHPSLYVIPWDFQHYAFNQESFLADSLRAGSFPLWDPYTYAGMAFFTNIQSQVFYPPTLLMAVLSNLAGPGHLMHFMTIELLLHVFCAGVFTYWLLRYLDCSRLAALIGATAFQLGCYFASQTQHLGAITGGVWLPLSALAILRLCERWSPKWVAILAISLALPILAGYPATICAVFLASLFLLLGLVVATRTARPVLIAGYAVGAAGAILLAAIQLIPTLQIATMSVSRYRGDWRGYGSGVRLEALPSLVWPNYHHILDLQGYNLPYNFTFLYIYCGIGTLLLAIVALVRGRRSYTIPFFAMALASALLMHGDATPPGAWLLTPLFNLTHDSVYPEFLMVGFSLGLAVLAGMGANALSHKPVVLGAMLVLVALDLTYFGSSRPMNTRALKIEPGVTTDQFDGSRELLSTVRHFVNQSQPPSRLETFGDAMAWTSMAPTIQVPTANGNDPFALIRFMNVRRLFCGGTRWGRYYEVSRTDSPILDLLNVRYLVSRKPMSETPRYRLVARMPGDHYLYENASALPRFFLVSHTIAAAGMDRGLELMRSSGFDPARTAVVDGAPARDYPDGELPPVRVIRYEQNELMVETDALQERFLVTSEAQYPGWRAYIDGSEAPIVLTNVAFRGLQIPAGHHRIEFRFRPSILWWSGAISALALLLAGWGLITPTRSSSRDLHGEA